MDNTQQFKQPIGQQDFVWQFFEYFHQSHEQLQGFHFTQTEVFKDKYISIVLSLGCPNDFEYNESPPNRRSMATSSDTLKSVNHLELRLFSNLKAFFKERDINCEDVLQSIKYQKMDENPKAYWKILFTIFAAFYLDHNQNQFLTDFFTHELPQNIVFLKNALDIMHSFLQQSQVTYVQEVEAEPQYQQMDQEPRDEIDPSELDPFADAKQISEIAQRLEDQKAKEIQAQFQQVVGKQKDEQQLQEQIMKNGQLEQQINELRHKLDNKKQKYKTAKEENFLLREQCQNTEQLLRSQNQELRQMEQVRVELEVLKNTDIINSKEMLKMISRLQELSAINAQLGSDLERSEDQRRSLEQHRDQLIYEIEIKKRHRDLSICQDEEQENEVEILDSNMPPNLNHIKLENRSQKSQIDVFEDYQDQEVDNYFDMKLRPSNEYYETYNNDTSFDLETTNQKLMVNNNYALDIENQNYNSNMPMKVDFDQLKKDLDREHLEKDQFRKQFYESEERVHHFERMKEEYEKLYSEFVKKSIRFQKEKTVLQEKLEKVNKTALLLSNLQCDRRCLESWTNKNHWDKHRIKKVAIIGSIALAILVVVIVLATSL